MAAAFRLENIGKSEELTDATVALMNLEREVHLLVEVLSAQSGRRA
jgi:hypothetical protein